MGTVSNGASHSLKWLWLSLLTIILDLGSKAWILATFHEFERLNVLPFFDLVLVYNPGAAFSFLADQGGWQRWFFTSISVVVSLILVIWLKRLPADKKILAAGLSLVLGGAIGNLFDRLWHGKVVDFLAVHWHEWAFPAFNIADSAITLGAILLIIDALFEHRRGNS